MRHIQLLIFSFILFCLPLNAQNIKLVFRYDDFTLKSNSLDDAVVRIFQQHQIPLVLGIIPCDSNEKMIFEKGYPFLPLLKKGVQEQSVEIAQHGLNHLKISYGEFGNLKKDEQTRRLQKGKTILDSIFNIKVVTFIPPWNAYDNNTLDVIEKNGMKGISSAICIGQPWSNSHISYFPETLEDFGLLMPTLEHNHNRNGVIVVMFHHYTFNRGYTLLYLDSLLTSINKLKYVHCVSFKQLYADNEISDKERMNYNMESNLLYKQLHMQGMIQTTSFAFWVKVLNIIVYLICSLLMYLLSLWLLNHFRRFNLNNKEIYIGILLLFFVGLSVYLHFLAPIKLLFAITFFSFVLALFSRAKFK